ncbi:RagB/SusD family nutrient uptake outer membrane protein [Galbibacter sp. PAP.153]|uniref:RagB/SusD family nutrient uptake outer membrane protein n=1 Tax=Galbibacter sp. PAP.153 TaxID=3104623 RepID=UPI003008469E
MKTTYINRIILSLLTIVLISCADNLNLEPEQSLTPDAATGNEKNIQNILTGAYDLAGQGELYGGQIYLISELLANDGEIFWGGTFSQPGEFNRKRITTTNSFVADLWIEGYETINQANIVLDNLNVVTEDSDKNRMEGEAKFIRGMMYFELVRFFAQPYETTQANDGLGVPIVLNSVTDASQIEFPSRSTISEVYSQAINDLTDAYNLLPESNEEFADKYTAEALLARIYLQQGNYPAARDAANDVIENSGHVITATYEGAFNNEFNSTEDILAWQVTAQDGINDMNTYWSTREFGGRSLTADVSIEPPYFDYFTVPDDRMNFFYEGNGTDVTTKWQAQFANVLFIRVAEMHLIRAESNFREGTSVGMSAEDEINAIRTRANADPIPGITLQDILDERKRELAFEGFAIHDIKRLHLNMDDLPYNDESLVLPIPQRDIDTNDNLEQNPGYN